MTIKAKATAILLNKNRENGQNSGKLAGHSMYFTVFTNFMVTKLQVFVLVRVTLNAPLVQGRDVREWLLTFPFPSIQFPFPPVPFPTF